MSDKRSGTQSSRSDRGAASSGASTELKLSPRRLAVSVLAATTGAVVASLFGVYGTVVGAALVSVVGTVAAPVFAASIRRARGQFHHPQEGTVAHDVQEGAVHAAARAREAAAHLGTAGWRRIFRWQVVVGVVAAFVLAMGLVTVIEAITGNTLSHSLGGSSQTGGGLTITGGHSRHTPTTTTPSAPASTSTPSKASSTPSNSSSPPSTASSSSPHH
jgi:hypothetical protein